MNSLVIYASRTGHTRKGADAIAEALRTRGSVQLLAADDVPACAGRDGSPVRRLPTLLANFASRAPG
jgi:hypothetical protein